MKILSLLFRLSFLAVAASLVFVPARAQDVGADTPINLPTPRGVRIFLDLTYVEQGGPRQKLDLYLPFPIPAKPMPVILYLHGGGWQKGSKADGRRFAFRMVAQGYAVACVNYRLSNEASFPAQIEDCKAAVRWLRTNAKRYRLDSPHFGVMGVSAGGYLAVLMGTTLSTRLFDSGADMDVPSSVEAVCDFFGPVDLLKWYEHADEFQTPQVDEVAKLLGGDPRTHPEQARMSNALTYLTGDAPPFLLIHGTTDTVVPLEQSKLLYAALVKIRTPVHLHVIRDAGHTGPAFVTPGINAMVDDFFSSVLRPDPQPTATPAALFTESTAAKN